MQVFPVLHSLLFLISTTSTLISAATNASVDHTTDFISSSCNSTSYPAVCIKYLSTYSPVVGRNPRQLAHAALTLSAARAHDASAYVSRLSSSAVITPKSGQQPRSSLTRPALHDCVTFMTDSASRLKQSVAQLNSLGSTIRPGSPKFIMAISNIQTWVSASLTDQTMCLSSLSQAKAAATPMWVAIRKKVVEVSQVTSNALSLVNKIN